MTAVAPGVSTALAATRIARHTSRRRYLLVCAGLSVLIFLGVCLACLGGSYPVPPAGIVPAIFGSGDPTTVYIVQELRIPRSVLALALGFTFGVSGAVFQSLARNPLASPDIVGISAGASLGAVIAIATIGSRTVGVPFAALIGAVVAGGVIVALSARRSLSSMRLILVGLGLEAMIGAATVMLQSRLDRVELEQANRWLSGSLSALGWGQVRVIVIGLALLMPLLVLGRRPLAVLQLGESVARSSGVAAGRWQLGLIVVGCALCALGVSVAGPILLIGFLGPPIARRLCGSPGPALVASGLTSAAVLVVADLIARFGIGSLNLPVGLLTGALGAPVLLWVILRRSRGGI